MKLCRMEPLHGMPCPIMPCLEKMLMPCQTTCVQVFWFVYVSSFYSDGLLRTLQIHYLGGFPLFTESSLYNQGSCMMRSSHIRELLILL